MDKSQDLLVGLQNFDLSLFDPLDSSDVDEEVPDLVGLQNSELWPFDLLHSPDIDGQVSDFLVGLQDFELRLFDFLALHLCTGGDFHVDQSTARLRLFHIHHVSAGSQHCIAESP